MMRLFRCSAVAVTALLIGCGSASSSDRPTIADDAEELRTAFVTCTPTDAAHASMGGDIVWEKLWISRNSKGQPKLTFRIRRGASAAKNEIWQGYESSPVNETTRTPTKLHVTLGEDVTYTLDASRSNATSPYVGTLVSTEEDTFAVQCR